MFAAWRHRVDIKGINLQSRAVDGRRTWESTQGIDPGRPAAASKRGVRWPSGALPESPAVSDLSDGSYVQV